MNRAIEMPRFFFFLFFLNFLKGFGELDENKFSSTGSSLYEWRAAECNKYRNRFSVLSDKNEVQSRAFDWLLSLTLRNRKEKKIKKKEKGGLLNSSFVWLARQSLNLLPRHPESIRVRRCLWKWIAKRIKKNKRDKTRKSAVGERGALSMGRQCLPSLVSSPLNLFFFSSFFLSFSLLFAFIYKRLSVVWSLTLSSTVATNNIPGSLSPSSFVAGIKVMASVSVCTCESSGFGRLVTFSVGQEGGTELFLPNMATRI